MFTLAYPFHVASCGIPFAECSSVTFREYHNGLEEYGFSQDMCDKSVKHALIELYAARNVKMKSELEKAEVLFLAFHYHYGGSMEVAHLR